MRRVNPVISYITVFTFVLCFSLSLWANIVHACANHTNNPNLATVLSPVFADNNIISKINFRYSQTEYRSFIPAILISNYFLFKFGPQLSFTDFICAEVLLSPWLKYAKTSMPTRAAPASFA